MNDPSTSTATIWSESMTEAERSAMNDRLPPMSRAVFFFDGTLEEFTRCLAASGAVISTVGISPYGSTPRMYSYDGLPCWEFDGKVWIGGRCDIRDAQEGRLPFKTIGKGWAT